MEKLNIEWEVPVSKSEIKIIDFLKWQNIEKENLEDELRTAMMLELFCGIPLNYIPYISQHQLIETINELNKTFAQEPELKYIIEFKGKKYGLIPSFDKHITARELDNLDLYMQENDWVRMLSILYRPIVGEVVSGLYQIEPFGETHTEFNELGLDILESTQVFFYNGVTDLLHATLKYTEKQIRISLKKKNSGSEMLEELNSLKNMVDTLKSTG